MKTENNDTVVTIKTCCICLEEQESVSDKLIEYNHCGVYYIHNKCLNDWNKNECLICRKKFCKIINENEASQLNVREDLNTNANDSSEDNDFISVLIEPNNNNTCKQLCINLFILGNLFCFGFFLILRYYN